MTNLVPDEVRDVVAAQACIVRATRTEVRDDDALSAPGLDHFGDLVDAWERALLAYDAEDPADEPDRRTWAALVAASRSVLARDIARLKEQIAILQAWMEHADGQSER
jgi:hypothetical protein